MMPRNTNLTVMGLGYLALTAATSRPQSEICYSGRGRALGVVPAGKDVTPHAPLIIKKGRLCKVAGVSLLNSSSRRLMTVEMLGISSPCTDRPGAALMLFVRGRVSASSIT